MWKGLHKSWRTLCCPILGPIVKPYPGAVGPGLTLLHYNPHVARVCRHFLKNGGNGHWLAPTFALTLTKIQQNTFVTIRFSPPNGITLHLILSRSSVIPWSRPGRRSPRTKPVILLHALMLSSMYTCTWGPWKLLSAILSYCNDILAKWTSLLHHFSHYPV